MSATSLQSRVAVLRDVPLFGAFKPEELDTLAELFVDQSYRRGETVCREGDEGENFFVCASGELEVWGGVPRRVINRLGPGEVLGEMSLLLGGKRAATVTASRNARLLVLDRAAFERYFLHNAKVLEYFSKILTKRLATMSRGEAIAKSTTTVAVTAAAGLRGKTLVASSLATLLAEFSERRAVRVVLDTSSPGESGVTLAELAHASAEGVMRHVRSQISGNGTLQVAVREDTEEAAGDALTELVARLATAFPIVVFEVSGPGRLAAGAAESVADVVVRVVQQPSLSQSAENRGSARVFEVVNLYNATSAPIPISHCEPFVVRDDVALRALDAAGQAAHVRAHPCSPASAALHRLARKILGASVGIVLGGGAAFGVAHIGVLQVLEDNGIPVDLVAGCSMGSLVAIGYAAGLRPADMAESALRLGNMRTLLWAMMDLTLTRPAILSGDRLVEILAPLAGEVRNFEQLIFPCRVVATDIETGERIAIGSGPTEIAGRASCAIPMLWSPVKYEGRVLVDGGVVDPVPAEVVRDMGADFCIAVNAVPQLRKGVETVLSTWYRRLKRLDPLSYLTGSQGMPNMFDLIMNSMQALQHELGNFKAISADVRINPDLSGLTWIEFYKPQELMDRGAEAAERALPETPARPGRAPARTTGGGGRFRSCRCRRLRRLIRPGRGRPRLRRAPIAP